MKNYILLFCLILASGVVLGQSTVILKGNKVLEGEIVRYDIGNTLVLELENGTEVIVRTHQIKEVYTNGESFFGKKKDREYFFEEKTFIFTWENNLLSNASNGGAGVSLSCLYQWKHYGNIGLGIGYDNYNFEEMRGHIPLFIHARSYVRAKRVTPYLDLKGGYGFSTGTNNEVFIDTKGGAFYQGMLGIRWGTNPFTVTTGIGLQFQDAYYYYSNRWNGGTIEENRQYRRLVMSLGFLF